MRSKTEQDLLCTLAKDLKNENNALLCRAEKKIDSHIFSLLEKVYESNPNFVFNIEIWKNDEIKIKLKEVFKNAVLVQMNANYIIEKTGKSIFDHYDEKLINTVYQALENDFVLYALYDAQFFNLKSKSGRYAFSKQILMAIRRALFSLGIEFTADKEREKDFYTKLFLTAFAASFILAEIQSNKLSEDTYRKKAGEVIKNNKAKYLKKMTIPPEIEKAVDHLIQGLLHSDYAYLKLNSEPALLAQIVSVGMQFEQLISPDAEMQVAGSRALDIIYVLAKHNKFQKDAVDTLAHWLEMKEVFRFYKTLERLENSCKFGPNGTNLAVPYPMRGIGSPTLFVCKGNYTDCNHLSSAFKKINIQEANYKLNFGAYTKCIWLTKELQEYYQKYYSKIKEETATQEGLHQA
ncbi:MAG: hypothetical protein H6696_15990 [Deferribacteres bacterium]|nr:hypothetical protein [Deferribacteres bacterium]